MTLLLLSLSFIPLFFFQSVILIIALLSCLFSSASSVSGPPLNISQLSGMLPVGSILGSVSKGRVAVHPDRLSESNSSTNVLIHWPEH